ncbi:MAG TPA: hypothetical protein VEK07_13980 [Polyangiaceae bacterium]|nr:hypothetical protein [Polyangiaceae bacterium]
MIGIARFRVSSTARAPATIAAVALIGSSLDARAQAEPTPAASASPSATGAAAYVAAAPCPATASCEGRFFLRASAPGVGYLSLAGQGPAGAASVAGVSFSGSLAMGGMPARGVVVGGMIRVSVTAAALHDAQTTPANTASVSLDRLGGLVDWYPLPGLGWHVGVELGVDLSTVSVTGGLSMTGLGFGGTLFGGYDWWVSPQWSLGVALSASTGTVETMVGSDGDEPGYRLWPADAAVDFTVLFQ